MAYFINKKLYYNKQMRLLSWMIFLPKINMSYANIVLSTHAVQKSNIQML